MITCLKFPLGTVEHLPVKYLPLSLQESFILWELQIPRTELLKLLVTKFDMQGNEEKLIPHQIKDQNHKSYFQTQVFIADYA